MAAKYKEIQFSDADVVNPSDFIPAGEYNPYNVHGFLLHDAGFVLAIVFAESLQDALDEAADAGKLDTFLIDESEADEYRLESDEPDSRVAFLGNNGRPFDIEGIDCAELPNPKFSYTALFNAEARRD